MTQEEAHEILWQHFAWEHEDQYGECGLDEDIPGVPWKRNYIIDGYDNTKGYARDWRTSEQGPDEYEPYPSVEQAAWCWFTGTFTEPT